MSIFKTLKYFGYFKRHPYFYGKYLFHILKAALGLDQVMTAEVFFDPACNFNCWHCSSSEWVNKKGKPRLTIDALDQMICNLKTVGVLSLCYVGGEPTTRTDLVDIIRLTNRHRVLPTIITNAALLDEEKIDKLFDAGLANMGFSLQSMDREVHDRLVNCQGAFDRMMKAIEYCVQRKHVCSVCVVPTNSNITNGDFDRLMNFAAQKGIRVNANLPAPVGRLMDDVSNILDQKAVDSLVEKYFPMANFLPDFKISNQTTRIRCPMGERCIYIFPDGEVCPCTFVHISFGNILHEPMRQIMQRMKGSALLKSFNRDGQCPIAMDSVFINKVKEVIKKGSEIPVKQYRN